MGLKPRSVPVSVSLAGDPGGPGLAPQLATAMIERFRQTGIRLDREGRFWHQGAEVTHRGLRRGLLRWLDVLDDGRAILRLDEHRYAYLELDDAHLLVTSVRWEGDRAVARLNDETVDELDYTSVVIGDGDALYCSVRNGRLEARITTSAYYQLAERIEQAGDAFALRARGRRFIIGRRERK